MSSTITVTIIHFKAIINWRLGYEARWGQLEWK